MKKQVDFIYRLEGPQVEEGISLDSLLPILVNFGQVIQESNRILNPKSGEIGINIKPFEKGSFLIEIALFAKTNYQQFVDLFNGDGVEAIINMLQMLGYVVGAPFSVIKIHQVLKGKPKSVEQTEPRKFKYTSNHGENIVVSEEIHKLYQNSLINEGVINIITMPLQVEGIDKVDTSLKNQEATKVNFSKQDADELRSYISKDEDLNDETQKKFIGEKTEDIVIEIVGPNFKNDEWKFSDGQSQFTAKVLDKSFMEKVNSRNESFAKGDFLKVRLTKKQYKVKVNLRAEYFIDEVLGREELEQLVLINENKK